VSLRLAGVRVSGGGVPGSGVGEMAKGRGERVEGVLVVPMRARDRALGLCPELSTVTARWRPAVVFWARGGARILQRKGRGRWRRVGRDAWAASASRRWPPGRPRAAAALNSGGVKQRSRQEKGEGGLICNFRKFQGSVCKHKDNF